MRLCAEVVCFALPLRMSLLGTNMKSLKNELREHLCFENPDGLRGDREVEVGNDTPNIDNSGISQILATIEAIDDDDQEIVDMVRARMTDETVYPTTICTLRPEDPGDYGAPLSNNTFEASAQSFEEIIEEVETSILDNDDWLSKLVKELDGIF